MLIRIPVPDGVAEAVLARPDEGPHPGVLLFMDAFGVRPQLQAMAERIASWGYIVVAPNVFHRLGSVAELAPTTDMTSPEGRRAAGELAFGRIDSVTPALARADLDAWVAALVSAGATTPIAVTGYCMGARLAVRAACDRPDVVATCGGFHGGGLATGASDSPHRGLPRARAEFLFRHADHDRSMDADAVARLGAALASAGLTASNEVYPGAPHGYTMADTAAFDEAASEHHYEQLRALLDRTVGVRSGRSAALG